MKKKYFWLASGTAIITTAVLIRMARKRRSDKEEKTMPSQPKEETGGSTEEKTMNVSEKKPVRPKTKQVQKVEGEIVWIPVIERRKFYSKKDDYCDWYSFEKPGRALRISPRGQGETNFNNYLI